ncbi:MAG: hypothetical protein HPY64_10230 [Anaerolineae bacterium]|nr:hypothetical protein [Anaerolineae bacterium]
MNFKQRSHLISTAIILVGVMLSGTLFFLNWTFGDRYNWTNWLMSLSYAVFIGSGLVAFLIELGARYTLPRGRVVGFFMIITWIAGSLLSTTLESISFLSQQFNRSLLLVFVVGGLFVLVIPGFLLLLFPWPPRLRRLSDEDSRNNDRKP